MYHLSLIRNQWVNTPKWSNGWDSQTSFSLFSLTEVIHADVALRLGNYYKDGIYVDKNLYEAQLYYLEAKTAIKKRLEHMEYVGDRSVAMAISNNLEEVEKEFAGIVM